MRFALLAALLLALGALPAGAQPVSADLGDLLARAEAEGVVPVIIRLRADLPRAKAGAPATLRARAFAIARAQAPVSSALARRGVALRYRYRHVPYLAARVSASDLRALASDLRVESITPDRLNRPLGAASSPVRPAFDVVGADVAHARGYTGAGQQIVVLDDGLDYDDARFAGRIATGACFSTTFDFGPGQPKSYSLCADSADVQTGSGSSDNDVPRCQIGGSNACTHGTTVASRAAVIAPGAGVIPMQVYARFEDIYFPDSPGVCGDDPCILSYESDQIAALDYAATLADSLDGMGDPVFSIAAVNMSIGSGAESSACDGDARKSAVDALRARGVPTVIASGNGGNRDAVARPSCISTAITVGISTDADAVRSNSDISPLVDFVTPGGTSSFTAPVVAAAWAVYLGARPGASVDSVESALTRSAKRIDDQRSGGIETDIPRLQLASALGLLVTTTEDGAGGSLRQNVGDALDGGLLTFASGLDGEVFPLGSGALGIARALTLDATSLPSGATLDGESENRVFDIEASGSLTLRGLTLTGGTAGAGDGGAVLNAGTLRMEGVTAHGNTGARGGALASSGAATLANVTLSGNTASSQGGGAFQSGGALGVVASTIYANTAGSGAAQIESQAGTLRLLGAALGASSGTLADCAAAGTLTSSRSHAEDGSCGAAQSGPLNLGPLEGTPVATHAPGPASPLADAGTCATSTLLGADLTTDARGLIRPVDLPSFADADDGCDIGAAEAQSEAALPVELVSFEAAQDGARVVLTWATASETNNAGFSVEMLGSGATEWTPRGFVAGNGTTLEAQRYTFALTDLAPGAYVVRLRQEDYDGAASYSPEIELAVTMAEAFRISAPWPNPARGGEARVEIAVREAQRVRVTLYDALGRRVVVAFDEQVPAQQARRVALPTHALASGAYLVRIQGERFAEVRRVTVVR